MPWLGVVGAAITGWGATTAGAMLVGGVVVGAAVGALYAAFTGGSILEGMMYGAVGGAAVGVGAYFAYGGAAGLAAEGGGGGLVGGAGGTTVSGSEAAQAGHMAYSAGQAGSTATSSYFATGGKVVGDAGIFAGSSGTNLLTSAASLGGAFMNGKSADEDRDSALAYKEKELAQSKELAELQSKTTLEAAGMSASTARENALTAAETAAADREENRRQFDNTFTEQKRQWDTNRDDILDAKERFNASVATSGNYAAGQSKSISLVETNRQRMELPQPSWTTGKEAPQVEVAATNQPQPQGGLLSGAAA